MSAPRVYRIGSRLVGLVSRFLLGTDLYPAAVAAVEELRNVSGETSYLSVFQDGEVNVMIALTGLRPVQARRMHRPGQSNIHSTASGKLLLAYQPREQAAALLGRRSTAQPFTPHTITDLDELLRELAAIRVPGIRARPRRRLHRGAVRGRAGLRRQRRVRGLGQRLLPCGAAERTEELIRLVSDAAEKISANLGAIPVRSTA